MKRGIQNPKVEWRLKVAVCVSTYNQESVIGACLESIVTQEVDFEVEILVSDDCSTDQTAAVVRDFETRYPELIRAIYQSANKGPGQNYIELHSVARGEYIAHIDGDDLMLPGKIRYQVDFLEKNPDFVLVWHRVSRLHLDGLKGYPAKRSKMSGVYELNDLLCFGTVAVHSSKMDWSELVALTRAKIVHKYDYEIDLLKLGHGKGFVLDDVLEIYCVSNGSLTSNSNSIWNQVRISILKERSLSRGPAGYHAAANLLLLVAIKILKRREGGWCFLLSISKFLTARSVFVFVSTIARRMRIIRDAGRYEINAL